MGIYINSGWTDRLDMIAQDEVAEKCKGSKNDEGQHVDIRTDEDNSSPLIVLCAGFILIPFSILRRPEARLLSRS